MNIISNTKCSEDERNGVHLKLDRFSHGIIRRKAKELTGRAGFTHQDFEDLKQELELQLLKSWPSYNPKIAHRNVYIVTIVERAAANILRNKRARKRYCQRTTFLHAPTDSGTSLADTISNADYDHRRGRDPRSHDELAQLRSAVAEVLLNLPPKLRDLAEQLKTKSLSEIAREMGVPRTTLNERVRRLRLVFERAGLRDYL
jgi:RNA polymerase sigma-70 factor (ECF subfamily)